jgi:hypothetical protein
MSMHLRFAISDIFGRVSAAERYRLIFYAETVEPVGTKLCIKFVSAPALYDFEVSSQICDTDPC